MKDAAAREANGESFRAIARSHGVQSVQIRNWSNNKTRKAMTRKSMTISWIYFTGTRIARTAAAMTTMMRVSVQITLVTSEVLSLDLVFV